MRTPSRTWAIGAALAVALVFSGCASSSGAAQPEPPSSIATRTASAPTASPVGVEDAAAVAVEAMTVYVSHEADADRWWSDLLPYLTPEAAYYVEGTNPLMIPATKITGEAIATANENGTVTVLVPTDYGQFSLLMVRRGDSPQSAPWSVFELTPPER